MDYYSKNAQELSERYRSLSADGVHGQWFSALCADRGTGRACDVGAGSGRDAHWLVEKGWSVVAVEPSIGMRNLAMADKSLELEWVDDRLPDLALMSSRQDRFDLILVSAVWQHLAPGCRRRAVNALGKLLLPEGILVITLRLGKNPEENAKRGFFSVSADCLEKQAFAAGLVSVFRSSREDQVRKHIQWESCAFRRSP